MRHCYNSELVILSSHRQAWQQHSHFPAQALLLESHDTFLQGGADFAKRLDRIESGQGLQARQVQRFADRLASEFHQWQWSMRCHEKYEESTLYPFLRRRFDLDCGALALDHERLHELAARCETSLASAAKELKKGRSSFALARRDLQRYREELARHLIAEEGMVVPLLLSLTSAEFTGYLGAESCAQSE